MLFADNSGRRESSSFFRIRYDTNSDGHELFYKPLPIGLVLDFCPKRLIIHLIVISNECETLESMIAYLALLPQRPLVRLRNNITPSYNCSKFIASTIESVLAQTYPNWEMVITDDCSTDDSVKIIEEYASRDSRIRLLKLEKNSGAGVARNNSIKESRGQYIAFLDSDDRWLPTKLEKQLALMKSTGCAASYTSYFTCTDKGDINGIILCRKKEDDFSIKCDDKMGNLTFMYDETVTGKIYMPSIRKRQDWAHKMAVMNICKKACGV